METTSRLREKFARIACRAAQISGTFWAFGAALGVILVWALSGPLFHFSDTWQLVINTGTTIVTFLMVFLIQHAQNRDMKALHLKLNELVAAVGKASNLLIDAEDLSEEEIDAMALRYRGLAERVRSRRSSTGGTRSVGGARSPGSTDDDLEVIPTRRRAHKRRSRGSGRAAR